MPVTKLVWILLVIAAVAAVAGVWQLSNARGYQTRGRRRQQGSPDMRENRVKLRERMTDTRQLTRSEKKLYKESQRLLAEGKIAPAARILEQLNMPREAIQCLEDHGYIDDAARILMRLQRPNRAGVIYARHGQWDKAAQCFKIANMPLEVGKCARQANNPIFAAEYFEKAGYLIDAAKCYLDSKDYLRAARLFLRANELGLAMASFAHLSGSRNCESISDPELKLIIEYLGQGPSDAGLADIIAQRNKLPDAIIELCRKGLMDAAKELYQRATADIGPQLLAEIDYYAPPAQELAGLFIKLGKGHYGGIVYERMGDYEKAASTFENTKDYTRAAYCYERARNTQKAKEMKAKAELEPRHKQEALKSISAFALSDVTATDQRSIHDDDAETVTVIHPMIDKDPPSASRLASAQINSGNLSSNQQQVVPEPPRVKFSLNAPDTNSQGVSTAAPTKASETPQENQAASPPLRRPSSISEGSILDHQRAAFWSVNLFSTLDQEQKNLLWTIGSTTSYNSGEDILNYGEDTEGLYVVLDGTVYLFHQQAGRDQVIETLSAGQFFGESWLLTDQSTSARCIAASSTTIRLLRHREFHDLLDKNATIAKKIYKQFSSALLQQFVTHKNSFKNQQAS